ncbi:MAG TPA: HAD family hydrolase [Nocardioides sp.]
MTPRRPLTAVLFDLDDTLVDHRGASRAGLDAWAASLGLTGTPDEVAELWTVLEMRYYAAYQRREISFLDQRRARVRAFLPHLDLASDTAADDAFAGYLVGYQSAWRAFGDATRALRRAAAAGLAIGVLTNGDAVHQRRKAEAVGLAGLLDGLGAPVLASSALPAAKPDARSYAAACRRLDADPATTLMVGDSLVNDVRGALDAGLTAVLLDRYDEHPTAGVRRVRSLDELVFAA